jgi:TetR/AcrR family transcriptional regulator
MGRAPGRPAANATTISRHDLLEHAYEEFSEKSFNDVSLRQLAKKIGVSDSLFNHHFGSKQKLWNEVVDTIIEREFRLLISELKTDSVQDNPLSMLRNYIVVMLQVAHDKPAMFKLIFSGLASGNERIYYLQDKYLKPYLKIVDKSLQLSIERKLIRPVTNVTLHTLILGCVDMLIRPEFALQGVNDSTNQGIQVDALVDVIMNGLTA